VAAMRRVPEGVLDPERQLGDDVSKLVDDGEFGELRKRLESWQRTLGHPGDRVGRRLGAAICGQASIRSVGSFGWTGSAKLRCVGNAGELQQFVQEVCRLAFVGLEPSSLRGAVTQEIPTYAQARAVDGFEKSAESADTRW
jgi:hypothetical protein